MPEFQPMSVGEILDRTFRVYRQNFVRFIAIMAIVQVPVTLIILFLQRLIGTGTPPAAPGNAGPPAAAVGGAILLLFVSLPLNLVAMTFARGALIKSVSETYLGNEVTVGEAFRFVLPRFGSLVWASFLVALVTGIGFLLFIVPGIIFLLWYSLTAAAVVIENRKAGEGMSRSKLLAKGNTGKIFLVLLVVFLIAVIIGALFGALGSIASRFLAGAQPSMAGTTLQTIFGLVGQVIAGPIGATAVIFLYYDLRIRKEGFDLEMLAKSLGSGGDRTGAAPQ